MKYKIKEIIPEKLSLNKIELNNGTIFNVKYNNDSLEFQTPKLFIDSLVKEKNQLSLKMMNTQACKTFYDKITEIEAFLTKTLKNKIKSIFYEDLLNIKIPFSHSKPLVKIYKDEKLFNYYHLEKDTNIICLVTLDKIWINNFNEPSYHLSAKEIMII